MINLMAKANFPTTQHTHACTTTYTQTPLYPRPPSWKGRWVVSVCLRGGQRCCTGLLKPSRVQVTALVAKEAGELGIK